MNIPNEIWLNIFTFCDKTCYLSIYNTNNEFRQLIKPFIFEKYENTVKYILDTNFTYEEILKFMTKQQLNKYNFYLDYLIDFKNYNEIIDENFSYSDLHLLNLYINCDIFFELRIPIKLKLKLKNYITIEIYVSKNNNYENNCFQNKEFQYSIFVSYAHYKLFNGIKIKKQKYLKFRSFYNFVPDTNYTFKHFILE